MVTANNTTDLRNGVVGELGCKAPARVASLINISLEGEQTINGVAVVENDIVLVTGQTDQTENGVYIVSTSDWQRAVWFDNSLDVVPGTLVLTVEGTSYSNTLWETACADNEIDFGTSEITFDVKVSGSNTGDQTITLTGEVTGSGTGSFAATISNNAVTNVKLSQVVTATFKGRATAGTGVVEDLTATQATALLNNVVGDSGSGGTKGLVPAPAAGDAAAGKFLKASGAWAVPPTASAASESTSGIAEIATQAETDAGTDDLRIVTPLKLKTARSYYMIIQDQKAAGTGGGTSASGSQTRTLNTIVSNAISGASLASNQITLPAGSYLIKGSAPSYATNGNKAYFYNVTDAANTTLIGTNAYGQAGTATIVKSEFQGVLTISSAKVFELRQYTQSNVADGLGLANNLGSLIEIYSTIEIEKIG